MTSFFFIVSCLLVMGTARAETSENLRSNKTYSLALGIGGRSYGFAELAFQGSYFLSANSQLTLSLDALDGTIREEADHEVDGDKLYFVGVSTEVKGQALAVSYKMFLNDTFYVDAGLDYAKASGEFRISRDITFSGKDITTDLGSYKKLSAQVQIGHQWQWDNFMLGTSWIGLLLPLSHSDDFADVAIGGEKPNSVQKFHDDAKKTQFTFLRFYLGWSF